MSRQLLAFLAAAATLVPANAASAMQGDPLGKRLIPFVSVNAKSVAIAHVRVVDGTGAPAKSDQTVVFAGGTITQAGAARDVRIPAGTTVVDGAGKTLLPGYVGMHNHLFTGAGSAGGFQLWRSMPFSFARLYLAAGTTTIRTTGTFEPYLDLNYKRSIDAGERIGPHEDVTSPYLTGPGNDDPQMVELRDPADGRATVDYWADRGVTSFKVYTNIAHDTLAAVIAEAHTRGLKVMGHLCSIGYHEAAALGIDELEHGPYFTDTEFVPGRKPGTCPSENEQNFANAAIDPDDPRIAALVADLVARRTPVSSTLPVFESSFGPSDAIEERTLDFLAPDQRAYVRGIRASLADPKFFGDPKIVPALRTLFTNEMAFEVAFERAGGILTCGPDPSGYGSVIAGLGDWREIELLVQAGLTPVEAIHVATQNGAIALGREREIGTIAAGKNADLTLVDGDPSVTIADIERVKTVFKDGVGYDSKKLFASVKGVVGIY